MEIQRYLQFLFTVWMTHRCTNIRGYIYIASIRTLIQHFVLNKRDNFVLFFFFLYFFLHYFIRFYPNFNRMLSVKSQHGQPPPPPTTAFCFFYFIFFTFFKCHMIISWDQTTLIYIFDGNGCPASTWMNNKYHSYTMDTKRITVLVSSLIFFRL